MFESCPRNQIQKEVPHELLFLNKPTVPEWWNGRHEGLKIPWALRPCGFEPRFRYFGINKVTYKSTFIGDLFLRCTTKEPQGLFFAFYSDNVQ